MKFKNDIKPLIGLLLVVLIIGIYGYCSIQPVKVNTLIKVKGTLKEKPYHGNQGGDMPRQYIRFELNEDNKKYYLIDCAYDMARKNEILNLSPGCELISFIKKEEFNLNKIYLYGLQVDNSEYLLKVSDYNRCYTNKWRLLVPIAIILILILGYKLFANSQLFITLKSRYLSKRKV